jgi:hypothetical protein
LWIGIGLILAIWLSTFFLQVPLHERLAQGFDAETHRSLVNTNWIRTAAWTLRAVLVLWLLWLALKSFFFAEIFRLNYSVAKGIQDFAYETR